MGNGPWINSFISRYLLNNVVAHLGNRPRIMSSISLCEQTKWINSLYFSCIELTSGITGMAQLDEGPWMNFFIYFSCTGSELTSVMAQLDEGPWMNFFLFLF